MTGIGPITVASRWMVLARAVRSRCGREGFDQCRRPQYGRKTFAPSPAARVAPIRIICADGSGFLYSGDVTLY